ncbi:MAG: hypothetical protein ACTHKT_04645 [Solirubrobacterales bacterium]
MFLTQPGDVDQRAADALDVVCGVAPFVEAARAGGFGFTPRGDGYRVVFPRVDRKLKFRGDFTGGVCAQDTVVEGGRHLVVRPIDVFEPVGFDLEQGAAPDPGSLDFARSNGGRAETTSTLTTGLLLLVGTAIAV